MFKILRNTKKRALASGRYSEQWVFWGSVTSGLVRIISLLLSPKQTFIVPKVLDRKKNDAHTSKKFPPDPCFVSGSPPSSALQTESVTLCLPSVWAAPVWGAEALTDKARQMKTYKPVRPHSYSGLSQIREVSVFTLAHHSPCQWSAGAKWTNPNQLQSSAAGWFFPVSTDTPPAALTLGRCRGGGYCSILQTGCHATELFQKNLNVRLIEELQSKRPLCCFSFFFKWKSQLYKKRESSGASFQSWLLFFIYWEMQSCSFCFAGDPDVWRMIRREYQRDSDSCQKPRRRPAVGRGGGGHLILTYKLVKSLGSAAPGLSLRLFHVRL